MQISCVFDLDGTLINSLADIAASCNFALEKLGFPTYETEQYRFFVGDGAAKLVERIVPADSRTPAVLAETRRLFDEYYGAHYLDKTRPYDGVPELLRELKKRGIKLGVVSNKPDVFVKELVAKLFGGAFDSVTGQREGIPRKPDPSGVLACCREMGVDAACCRYIGDSGVDMLTAKAAGAYGIGALWGFRGKDELLRDGALALIASPLELLDRVG
jgi:phosphoglycolate phosphatase